MLTRCWQIAMAFIAMICAYPIAIQAQSVPPYVTIQDSVHLLRIVGGDTIPASWYAPSYQYEMVYDPYCRTDFIFTECRKNDEMLKLRSWSNRRLVHAPAELLTFNSRTENFQVAAGDTVSFYRSLDWYNPVTFRQDTNNYYSLDTLEMIVHLVKAADGTPIQLDSIGILPRVPAGIPVIYGQRPIMAHVKYVVPPALNGNSVFVGVTVRARGQGAFNFLRLDAVTVGESERLKEARYVDYLNLYDGFRIHNGAYARRSINELTRSSEKIGVPLSVMNVPGAPRDIWITFGTRDKPATLALYDGSGRLVNSWPDVRTTGSEAVITYRVTTAGTYFVALICEDVIVTSTKIIVPE